MLRASLDTFSADEILGLIGRARATGAVRVFGPHTLGTVFCHEGSVTFATTDAADDLLGVLTRAGFVRDAHPADATGLAEYLMNVGLDMQRLHDFVRHRTEESTFELSMWTEGHLEFDAGVDHPYGDAFSYPMSGVLDGVSRRRMQWARFLERLPSTDTVVAQVAALAGDDGDLTISRTQWRVLAAVDGRRSIAELAHALGTGLFSTVQLLVSLLDSGLIAVVDAPAYEEPLAVATSRASAVSSVEVPSATAAFGNGFEPSSGHHVAPAAAGVSVALATDPVTDLGMGGIEFVNGIGERPSRDLILRLLSAVKEL
ncbi:MAG: hypothetical protein QOE63_459 [Acidimicrobiaceae bacterium]